MKFYPVKTNTVSSADEIGMLVDLERITGEDLFAYKKRMLELSSKITNSSHDGLLNGIANSLGLNEKSALKIELRNPINTSDLNINRPRVLITASKIILYKNYLNEDNFQIEMTIDLTDPHLTHKDVVSLINSQSTIYQATDLLPDVYDLKAFTFRKKDSDIIVLREPVKATKFFKLNNKNIKHGSLRFSESDIFRNELLDLEDESISKYQAYSVDYNNGIVKTILTPSGNGYVSYIYSELPFIIKSNPAALLSFTDEAADEILFTQQEKKTYNNTLDMFVPSQPKIDMVEYISELLKVSNQTWGE